jgi:hypothetical protein
MAVTSGSIPTALKQGQHKSIAQAKNNYRAGTVKAVAKSKGTAGMKSMGKRKG